MCYWAQFILEFTKRKTITISQWWGNPQYQGILTNSKKWSYVLKGAIFCQFVYITSLLLANVPNILGSEIELLWFLLVMGVQFTRYFSWIFIFKRKHEYNCNLLKLKNSSIRSLNSLFIKIRISSNKWMILENIHIDNQST